MEHATARLDLQWRHEEGGVARSRLDERFLSGHNLPAPVSLPFLPDLHNEIVKPWDKPYSARIHRYKHANYADIEGMREHGYASMPPIEGTLASYLSAGGTSTLKAPALPSKPLKDGRMVSLEWSGIRGSRSGRCCSAHDGSIAGVPG